MPNLSLSIQYQKNTGQVFSATELKTLFFTGIKLEDQFGNIISQETIDFYIQSAQKELSDQLSIKLTKQAYIETKDFKFDDWVQWGHVNTLYPVIKPLSMKGFLNTTLQINYPQQWLSTKSQSTDKDVYWRKINLVPISGSATSMSGTTSYVGVSPYLSYFGSKQIPNYWTVTYTTGFDFIPQDILMAIGKMAAIDLLLQLNDLVTGLPGINTKSLSIDGLSQSTSSQGYLARIKVYRSELDRQLPLLKGRYTGIIFGVC